jgi:hypothetical protein
MHDSPRKTARAMKHHVPRNNPAYLANSKDAPSSATIGSQLGLRASKRVSHQSSSNRFLLAWFTMGRTRFHSSMWPTTKQQGLSWCPFTRVSQAYVLRTIWKSGFTNMPYLQSLSRQDTRDTTARKPLCEENECCYDWLECNMKLNIGTEHETSYGQTIVRSDDRTRGSVACISESPRTWTGEHSPSVTSTALLGSGSSRMIPTLVATAMGVDSFRLLARLRSVDCRT